MDRKPNGKKHMNCAFLFSGQLRGFNHCIEKIKLSIASQFDESDYFFYLPYEDYNNLSKVILLKPKVLTIAEDSYDPLEEKIKTENDISYSDTKIARNGYSLKGRIQHYLLQWYGVQYVYNMMENYSSLTGKKYDLVCRIRCDHFPITPFVLSSIRTNCVNIPLAAGSSNDDFGGIHDRFAIGDMTSMKTYCNKYNSIKIDNIGLGNSENKLLTHLKNNNTTINRFFYFYERLNADGTIQAWR